MAKILQKMWDGVIYGTGFLLFYGAIFSVGLVVFSDFSLTQLLKSKSADLGIVEEVVQAPDEIETTVLRYYDQGPLPLPQGMLQSYVTNKKEFLTAISDAHSANGNTVITLAKGTYKLSKTVHIKADSIVIRSETGNPYDVIITGVGMRRGGRVTNLFRVSADHFTLDGVTLTDTTHHLIQIAGEQNASFARISNSILQNSYEQMLKVSYDLTGRPNNRSVNGIVENCVFQYTQGVAPNYYTGGVDALGAEGWIVRGNVFRDIASPKERISQHAVHFWVNSKDNQVTGNLFVDNDRAIGFGMPLPSHSQAEYSHHGGIIEGNIIFHSDNGDPFGDVGIILESSANSVIRSNVVFQEHDYPNGIEYRFDKTVNTLIINNKTNRDIRSRDNATSALEDNDFELERVDFIYMMREISEKLNIVNLNEPIKEKS